MIKEVIILDNLNVKHVCVVTKKVYIENGIEYTIGQEHRCCYENNADDRILIKKVLPESYLKAVLNVWGE